MTGDTTAASPEQAEPRLVVMLVYPGVMAMDVFGPLEAFASANIIAGRPLYRLAIAGKTTALVETSLGLPIVPSVALDDIEGPIDTLLVSGGFGQSDASSDQQLIAWLKPVAGAPLRLDLHRRLRARRRRPARRQAGDHALGDGRRAQPPLSAGHRRGRPHLRARRQRLHLGRRHHRHRPGAGLIEEDHGRTMSLRVARALVAYLKRPAGQSQFSNHLLAQFAASPAVRLAQEWALEHLAGDLSAKALAKRAGMSERSFRRAFVEETGETRARLRRAHPHRRRTRPVRGGAIGGAGRGQACCGFATVDNLRRAFVRRLGVTPQQYRQRFRLADNEATTAAAD